MIPDIVVKGTPYWLEPRTYDDIRGGEMVYRAQGAPTLDGELNCIHENTVLDTTGSRRFVDGDVDDDIEVRVLCLDCKETISETDISGGDPEELPY